ncbi:MAG: hypothetical protein EOP82_22365 [Variovorax sp.]|nr:MAG: hypothetical protein EOP82_22365 [Variovorax sp.]
MNATSISIIPPGTGGVRDYASLVGSSLHSPLMELTPATDTSALSGDFLLLHFSGYGFQKRGVPVWLVRRMRELRTQFGALGVVFHELYASGPPWRSAFWLHGYQKRIAKQLLGLSDFWVSNNEESARWLLGKGLPKAHRVLPVFSNVGEPPPAESERRPELIVFGSVGIRTMVYEWADGEVFRCARRNGLQIHDIGPSMQDGVLQQRLADEGVVARGKLPAEQVSAAMSTARYGAVAYPTHCVCKSGVFAAYAAHGLCPILLSKDYATHDGLEANIHYAAGFDAADASVTDPNAVSREVRRWYEPHSVKAHAAALSALASEVRR